MDRRDATMLGSLFRAGELQGVWLPDADHEAMRELIRGTRTKILGKGCVPSMPASYPASMAEADPPHVGEALSTRVEQNLLQIASTVSDC